MGVPHSQVGGGGFPLSRQGGRLPPSQQGYPLPRQGGTPSQGGCTPFPDRGTSYLPNWTWEGGTTRLNLRRGTPCLDLRRGVSPSAHLDLPKGVPPLSRCGLTHKVKLLPSLILRMRAVKMHLHRVRGRKKVKIVFFLMIATQ